MNDDDVATTAAGQAGQAAPQPANLFPTQTPTNSETKFENI